MGEWGLGNEKNYWSILEKKKIVEKERIKIVEKKLKVLDIWDDIKQIDNVKEM